MDGWADFAIVASVLAFVYIIVVILMKRQEVKTLYKLKADLNSIDQTFKIELFDYDDTYQISAENDKEVFLVKVVNANANQELIITNSNKWGINKNIKNFRRSSVPDFVPLVHEFLNYKATSEKPIKKIALIHPDCHNIVKYLNESDAIVVNNEKPIDGVYFVKYKDMKSFFEKH